jgi:hypothetical protein
MRFPAVLLLATSFVAPPAAAQTSGTYTLEGTNYAIDVLFAPGKVTVVEPNKRSEYTMTRAGRYEFTNPTNGIRYGLQVIDAATIEAFKPLDPGSPPTTLVLTDRQAAGAQAATYDAHMKVANKYRALAESDADSPHVWAACAAAAYSRATQTSETANWYARDASALLKPIMVNPKTTPCPDAISQRHWDGH